MSCQGPNWRSNPKCAGLTGPLPKGGQPMSIFSSIGNAIKSVLPTAGAIGGTVLGGAIGGPLGAGIGGSIGGSIGGKVKTLPPLPGAGGRGGGIIGGAIGTVGGMARGIGGRVASAARGAAAMCARYPQWCVAAGGVAAIAGMMQSGQLPIPKRRRRRGITPRDLQSFRRVAGLIKSYGPTARKVPTRCAPKRPCK